MTLDFFYENYDLTDMEIKRATIKNNKLVLDVVVTAYLELIANGYRPELDVEHEIVFTFSVNCNDRVFDNPVINSVSFESSKLTIEINKEKLLVTDNNVDVLQKE